MSPEELKTLINEAVTVAFNARVSASADDDDATHTQAEARKTELAAKKMAIDNEMQAIVDDTWAGPWDALNSQPAQMVMERVDLTTGKKACSFQRQDGTIKFIEWPCDLCEKTGKKESENELPGVSRTQYTKEPTSYTFASSASKEPTMSSASELAGKSPSGFVQEVAKPPLTISPYRKEVLHHGSMGKRSKMNEQDDYGNKATERNLMGRVHDKCDLNNEAGTTDHRVAQQALTTQIHDECDLNDEAGTTDHGVQAIQKAPTIQTYDKCDLNNGAGMTDHGFATAGDNVIEAERKILQARTGRTNMKCCLLTLIGHVGSISIVPQKILNDDCSNVNPMDLTLFNTCYPHIMINTSHIVKVHRIGQSTTTGYCRVPIWMREYIFTSYRFLQQGQPIVPSLSLLSAILDNKVQGIIFQNTSNKLIYLKRGQVLGRATTGAIGYISNTSIVVDWSDLMQLKVRM